MKGEPNKGQSFHSFDRGRRALDMGKVVVDHIISRLRHFIVDRLKSDRSR